MRKRSKTTPASNPIKALVEAIAELAQSTGPYSNILFGSDPPENGLCMIQDGGYPPDTHFDKGMVYDLPFLLNGKHSDQELLLATLEAIHALLTKMRDYSGLGSEHIQVIDIRTMSYPMIIGREQNNQWICGSSFDVYFYWR